MRLPQARNGSFFPSCLERWQTSEQALAAALGEMVIKGVSTRKVSQLAQEMLGVEVSASTVSNLVKVIEPKVNAFRERPLGNYRYLTCATVVRPDDHPLRTSTYLPINRFLAVAGFHPLPALMTEFSWLETDGVTRRHPMNFWLKEL